MEQGSSGNNESQACPCALSHPLMFSLHVFPALFCIAAGGFSILPLTLQFLLKLLDFLLSSLDLYTHTYIQTYFKICQCTLL